MRNIELTFERRLAHPRAKVWRALTESDHLRVWFVHVIDYDRSQLDFAPGAKLEFVFNGDASAAQGGVTTCDPPRMLEYTWDGEVLRWELTEDGPDACVLVFTNIVGDPGTAEAVKPGWEAGLDALEAHLEHV